MKIIIHLFIQFVFCSTLLNYAYTQPASTIDIEKQKPEKYENRRLNAEKTGEKKLTAPKRFFQNNFTHYNYFFNANNKVNTIINKAKASFKDDYTQLLPFYNYSLNSTAEEKLEIDSIIYKTTAGILLHNLENAWIDDLYMLMGKAYFLKKDFDSAKFVFQYINYAWSPKDDGYDILLGSNTSNTNGVFTIVTKEKKNLIAKLVSKHQARNESLLWQAKTLLQQGKIADASGLLSLLKTDANFPERLLTDLNENLAYAFYIQQSYDSAATHLNKALNNAENRTEKARWHFLCGQLFQLAGKKADAALHFKKSVSLATDPLMEVYARLNLVNVSSLQKENIVLDNLNELYKLSKKDRFEDQRDMIFYAAATLEQKQLNNKNAIVALRKSIAATTDNLSLKNKSFAMMGNLFFDDKNFTEAFNAYDSIALDNLEENIKEKIKYRKEALKIITTNQKLIQFEDSVRIIAEMPEAERTVLIKKLVKKLRKAEGLKEEEAVDFGNENALPINGSNTAPSSLNIFGSVSVNDFYFNNPSSKQKGNAEFKTKWGSRPNVDNWRRQAAFTNLNQNNTNNTGPTVISDVDDAPLAPLQSVSDNFQTPAAKDLSFEGLMKDIPLLEEQKRNAEKKQSDALFENAVTFQNTLQEYNFAIQLYEEFLKKFKEDKRKEEILYNLQFCYDRLGKTFQKDSIINILQQQFTDGAYYKQVVNGPKKQIENISNTYEKIYALFIEGSYEKAIASKQEADKLLGKSYWKPQLLWIESIYYVKQNKDSIAIQTLQNLIQQFPENALALKAQTMIDVLYRRTEIETHLNNFSETRKEDTLVNKRVDLNETATVSLDNKKAEMNIADLAKTRTDLLPNSTITNNATTVTKPEKIGFTFNPSDPHFVVLVLQKVDEVYVNEAKNAFNRFNAERFYNEKIKISIEKIDNDCVYLTFSNFGNAGEALNYIEKIKPSTANRIIPWLAASKYYFTIINTNNLLLLKANKEVNNYKEFIHQIFPDKL